MGNEHGIFAENFYRNDIVPPILIALDTAWGTRHGGINAFNTELVKALSIQPDREFEVYCVLLKVEAAQIAEIQASHALHLCSLDLSGDRLLPVHASEVVALLQRQGVSDFSSVIWLGHDDKTGPLALALGRQYGGQVALIHHMAHGAYQGFKKGDSTQAVDKGEEQRQLFKEADFCLAVGPRLKRELEHLLSTEKDKPPVCMLVPGLAEPEKHEVHCLEQPPTYFGGFAAGRLSAEDDRIKQGRLALRSFADEVRKAREDVGPQALQDNSRFCLMGLEVGEETAIRQDLERWAEAQLQVDLLPFSEDRSAYFRKLASSSFAMMLSWHEGFGLTGWEAIAARVPLILGKNSGLYELLRDEFSGFGENNCLFPLDIRGHLSQKDGEENHRQEDVDAVGKAIRRIAADPARAKKAAINLRNFIAGQEWDWRRTARDLMEALSLPTKAPCVQPTPAPEPSAPSDLPHWLALPAKPAWNPDWGWSPAVLLQAASAVVPFDPSRKPLLDDLLTWAEAGAHPIQIATYTGPGGTGKTRLALEAARSLVERGWQCHWLGSDKPEDWLAQWQNCWQPQQPALIVLDYAETRGAEVLAILAAAMARLAGGAPLSLRLVLLARNAGDWWRELASSGPAAALLSGLATRPPQTISPLAVTDREAAYQAALQALALALGQTEPRSHYRPPLTEALFERPLYLQLAALAALEGRAPASADTLLEAQLNREWSYWQLGPGLQCQLSRDDWADALALLALTGGCPAITAAGTWLEQLGLSPKLATALAAAYPAPGHGITPLQPDLLAEWLLRQCLAGERGESLLVIALTQAPQAALTFLGRLCAEGDGRTPLNEAEAAVLQTVLTQSWPQLGQLALQVAHDSPPGLGKRLAKAWLSLELDVQGDLAALLQLPYYSVCLLDLAVLVERAHLEMVGEDVEQRAGVLNNLANRLSEQGDAAARTEALACAREAVDVYRLLAETQPAAYLPNVAASFNNLANRLAEQGDVAARTEVLACASEAVDVYRELAQTQPAVYLPNVAASLNNLAVHLAEQGDAAARTEALTCARESLAIRRQLAQTQTADYLPDVAMSLNTLANRLAEQGDTVARAEALAYAREAVGVYRQLAQTQPAAYLPNVAGSLNNLANRLVEQGDAEARTEALACAREAVDVYRKLAETQPAAYLPNVAGSLNNLASHLAEQGHAAERTEALACVREALAIRRQLAQTQPVAYLPDVAASLNNLAIRLAEQGNTAERTEALVCAREALAIRRQLAQTQPAAYLPDVAASINNLAIRLAEQGDAGARAEALACAREAVGVYFQLWQAMPAVFELNLGKACRTLARIAKAAGLDGQAEVAAVVAAIQAAAADETASEA